MPTNLMRDSHWDIDGFPHLLPSGKNGLHHERENRLAPYLYFDQRLNNVDNRFRNSSSYSFAALNYLERQRMEERINLACQRGKFQDGTFDETNDPMLIFENISGTHLYWKKVRYDMIAKIEQLGPFQFFFTLSCADMRWAENIISVLQQAGHNIVFEKNAGTREICRLQRAKMKPIGSIQRTCGSER